MPTDLQDVTKEKATGSVCITKPWPPLRISMIGSSDDLRHSCRRTSLTFRQSESLCPPTSMSNEP